MRIWAGAFIAVFVATLVAGCGGGDQAPVKGQPDSVQFAQQQPETLDDEPERPGEIIVSGQGPRVHGPYNFSPGGYTVRWEQWDPEARVLDFRREARSFVASLESKPDEVDEPYQLLAHATKQAGSNSVTTSGRLYVNVSADYAYVLRFTPK